MGQTPMPPGTSPRIQLDVFGTRPARVRRAIWSSLGVLLFGVIAVATGWGATAIATGNFADDTGQTESRWLALIPGVLCLFFSAMTILCVWLSLLSIRGYAFLEGSVLTMRGAFHTRQFDLSHLTAEIQRAPQPQRSNFFRPSTVTLEETGPHVMKLSNGAKTAAQLQLEQGGELLPAEQLRALASVVAPPNTADALRNLAEQSRADKSA